LAYTALMKAVLRESPRVGALGLYALPLLVYLQQQMHTLSADASATLHHYLSRYSHNRLASAGKATGYPHSPTVL